jgi:hypothetical protein
VGGVRSGNTSMIFFAWKVRDIIWKVGQFVKKEQCGISQYVSNGEKTQQT